MVLKAIANVFSPGGAKARLSILMFHRVLPASDPLFPDELYAEQFNDVLSWIGRWFRVLPLDLAVHQLKQGSLPSRALCITFDDGYGDNATVALPLLQRHAMPATFFVATSFMDGGRMWNDSIIESVRLSRVGALDLRDHGLGLHTLGSIAERQQAIEQILPQIKYMEMTERMQAVSLVEAEAKVSLPGDLMMTGEQVRQLRYAGMQIGAHTCTHPILARLPAIYAERELVDSKATLEAILDEPVTLFAYPNGKPGRDYLGEHARLAKSVGFAAAVCTAPGVATTATDIYQLPRLSPWGRTPLRYGMRLLYNLRNTQSDVV